MTIKDKNGYIKYSVDDMNEDELVIDIVEVLKKRQGTGTKLVKEVIEIAQNENKKLSLCAYPQDDSISLDNLVEFYKKLGFVIDYDTGEEVLMTYQI